MEKEWILMVQQQNQLGNLLKTNQKTEKFGLSISEQDAEMILQERKNALQEQKRIEFGEGIVQKIIYEFCDSDYIDQNNYVNTIIRLQEIFYLYKNEMNDEITDDELLMEAVLLSLFQTRLLSIYLIGNISHTPYCRDSFLKFLLMQVHGFSGISHFGTQGIQNHRLDVTVWLFSVKGFL